MCVSVCVCVCLCVFVYIELMHIRERNCGNILIYTNSSSSNCTATHCNTLPPTATHVCLYIELMHIREFFCIYTCVCAYSYMCVCACTQMQRPSYMQSLCVCACAYI